MNAEKSILVLGGTGAMGRYLVPKLADDGYRVDVVSLDDWTSDRANLRFAPSCWQITTTGSSIS